jgi:DNA-binding SARP family transcriptional activator
MQEINIITLAEPGCVANGVSVALSTQKRRFALLAYLALERSAPRARVAALFYPEIDERRAARRLTQTIYALRRQLGSDCIESRGAELRARAALVSDACQFGTLAERGDYAEALALYERPFLDGFYVNRATEWERWAERRRGVFARIYAQAARLWIARLIDQGSHESAIAQANRWLEVDAESQEAHRFIMVALMGAGRVDDALRHYRAWERDLLVHHGDQPSDSMKALLEELNGVANAQAEGLKELKPLADKGNETPRPLTLVRDATPVADAADNAGTDSHNRLKRAMQRLAYRIVAM